MPQRMRTSRAGVELIKSFEGFYSRTVRVDDNHWVIGYGHVRRTQDPYRISRDEAEQVLREHDLPKFEALVSNNTYTPLHQSAFDALVSFAFNIGADEFLGSDVLACLNAGDVFGAAEAMGMWRKAMIEGRSIVVDTLVRRRAAEKALLLSYPSGPAPAPSAIVKPAIDTSASHPRLKERAVIVETNVVGEEVRASTRSEDQQSVAPSSRSANAIRVEERLERRIENYLDDDTSEPQFVEDGASTQETGPTPQEIMEAVAALVNDDHPTGEVDTVEDLPGVNLEEPETNEQTTFEDSNYNFVPLDETQKGHRNERVLGDAPEVTEHIVIDDLEELDIDQIRKMAIVKEVSQENSFLSGFRNLWPFALLSIVGAGLFTLGTILYKGSSSNGAETSNPFELVLMILGALLFCVMSYYFIREYLANENTNA